MLDFIWVMRFFDNDSFFGVIIETSAGTLGEILDNGRPIGGEIENPCIGGVDVVDFFGRRRQNLSHFSASRFNPNKDYAF